MFVMFDKSLIMTEHMRDSVRSVWDAQIHTESHTTLTSDHSTLHQQYQALQRTSGWALAPAPLNTQVFVFASRDLEQDTMLTAKLKKSGFKHP